MEEIYTNVEHGKAVFQITTSQIEGSSSSKKRPFLLAIIFLGILNVLLLVGLIILGLHSWNLAAGLSNINENLTDRLQESNGKLYSMTEERNLLYANLTEMMKKLNRPQAWDLAADLSNINDNLTDRLQDSNSKLYSMTEERNLLHANLTEMVKKLNRPRAKTCPTGWTKFSCTCYFVSTKSGSWDEGRKDCITRGADLVVINDKEEQDFISSFANEAAWIGLIDKETEGSWKWVDGTSMTISFWRDNQPDNWNGDEDCGQYINKQWNDYPCAASLKWICEKLPPWSA